jgi:DNA repair photolyase
LDLENFFKDILVKTNVAECLSAEMKRKNWKREQIKIGGTTDSYQHIEKKQELMPKIFDVIKKHRNPIFIQTKSTLILRDFEIIRELSKITTVDIATSISIFDESIQKIIEPGASTTIERIEMLAKFNGIARSTTLGFMPIIPLLSDTDENLETIFRLTKEYRIDNIVPSMLFLRGDGKPKFFELIKKHFPEIYPEFSKIYKSSTADDIYARKLYSKIEKLRNTYQLHGIYTPAEISENQGQLSLFPQNAAIANRKIKSTF